MKLQIKVRLNIGGTKMKGVRTHESKKRPDARLDRKRWKNAFGGW